MAPTIALDCSVAVVVPNFNKADSIVQSLQSILHQSHEPMEIIVVDDGSRDNSLDLIAEAGFLKSVTLIKQPNQGPGAARNAGWEAASSEWVAFLDADDSWSPDHLSTLCSLTKKWPSVDWVATRPKFENRGGRRYPNGLRDVLATGSPAIRRLKDRRISYFRVFRKQVLVPQTSCIMVRRTVLKELGGFQDSLPYEDFPLWCALALRGSMAISRSSTARIAAYGDSASQKNRRASVETAMYDSSAIFALPHYQVVARAIASGIPDCKVELEARRYLDALLTRHWPTVIFHQSQAAARLASQSLVHRRGLQYILFLVAAHLPKPLARISALMARRLVKLLGFEAPVSPFLRRRDYRD